MAETTARANRSHTREKSSPCNPEATKRLPQPSSTSGDTNIHNTKDYINNTLCYTTQN